MNRNSRASGDLTRRGLLRAALGAGLLPAVAAAAQARLSDADQADIARIEGYLNGIATAQARFVQIGANGELARGSFYLRRPGRLRFEYDPPVPLLIVADGLWLVIYDRELKQVNRLPLYETPLGVLVAEKVRLSGDVQVTQVERQAGILRVQMIDTDRPDEGWLSLAFSEPPLELRQWHVRDAQGGVTNVSLSDFETGIELDPKLFVFIDPEPFRE